MSQPQLSNRMRERLALAIFTKIGSNFVAGQPPWTLHQLTNQLSVPMHAIDSVLQALQQAELLRQSNDDPPTYLPGRDLASISIGSVLATVRSAGEDGFLTPQSLSLPQSVDAIVTKIEVAADLAVQGQSIRTLIAQVDLR